MWSTHRRAFASLNFVPDAALADHLTESAERLLHATDCGYIEGADIARAVGRNPREPAVHHAFREIERRGTLRLEAWEGGMGLPQIIALP